MLESQACARLSSLLPRELLPGVVYKPGLLALGRWRYVDIEFKTRLVYLVSYWLNKAKSLSVCSRHKTVGLICKRKIQQD